MSPLPDRHLDLGCGKRPRNPYGRALLCGTDVRALQPEDLPDPAIDYRVANVVLDPIPWPDHHFGSVSAFDFIEHVPRLLMTPDGRSTVFPFVRLMDEVWRVLAPGGCFYALTPAYPSPQAFQDPTHVNIITDQTHTYFCGERPLGRIYGFSGQFEVMRVGWVDQATHFTAVPSTPADHGQPVAPHRRMAHAVRDGVRWLRGRSVGAPPSIYLLWEWRAIK
jgi:SAM-dependent methyltransferase